MNAETAYLFRHALMREAAYSLYPPGERGALHALAGELLRGLGKDAYAAEAAEHFRQARMSGAGDQGVWAEREAELRGRAGDHSRRRYQPDEAAKQWTAQAEVPGVTQPVRVEALLSAAGVLLEQGSSDVAAELVGTAIDECEPGDDKQLARAWRYLASARAKQGRPAEALEHIEKALARAVRTGDPALLHQATLTKGMLLRMVGRLEEAEALLRSSLATATDRREVAALQGNLGALLSDAARDLEARQHYAEALRLHAEDDDRASVAIATGNLANCTQRTEGLEVAEPIYRRAIALHLELGRVVSAALVRSNLGGHLAQTERLEEARTLLLESLRVEEEHASVWQRLSTQSRLGLAYLQGGDLAAAEATFRAVTQQAGVAGLARVHGVALDGLADLCVRAGRYAEAEAHAREAIAFSERAGNRAFVGISCFNLAKALFAQGRSTEAEAEWQKARETLRQTQRDEVVQMHTAAIEAFRRREGS